MYFSLVQPCFGRRKLFNRLLYCVDVHCLVIKLLLLSENGVWPARNKNLWFGLLHLFSYQRQQQDSLPQSQDAIQSPEKPCVWSNISSDVLRFRFACGDRECVRAGTCNASISIGYSERRKYKWRGVFEQGFTTLCLITVSSV